MPSGAPRRQAPEPPTHDRLCNEGSSAASGDLGRTASKVSLSTRIERRHRRDPASRLQRFVGWLSFLSHHNQFHQQMSGRALYGFRRWTGAASSETPAAPPGGASPRLGALMSGQYGCRRLSFPAHVDAGWLAAPSRSTVGMLLRDDGWAHCRWPRDDPPRTER